MIQGYLAAYDAEFPERPTEKTLRALLLHVVDQTGLQPIHDAHVTLQKDGHWSALQMIAESHIAFEGFKCWAVGIVFTCRQFDPDRMAEVLRDGIKGTVRLRHWEAGKGMLIFGAEH